MRGIRVGSKSEAGLQQHRLAGGERETQYPRFLIRLFVAFYYVFSDFEHNRRAGALSKLDTRFHHEWSVHIVMLNRIP